MASAPVAPDTRAATAARVTRARLRRSLKCGEIALAEALEHDAAFGMRVEEVVGALPFSSKPKRPDGHARHARHSADRVCELAGIEGHRLVGLLSPEGRAAIVEAYRAYHRGAR